MMITRLTISIALLLGCSPPTALQLAADDDAHPSPAGTPRTVGALADELFALIDSTPEPDAYGRHLVTMAGELVMLARLAAPSGDTRITCSGRYQSAGCWNVSCECETLNACTTVSKWCRAIDGEESGRSCSKTTKSGCL